MMCGIMVQPNVRLENLRLYDAAAWTTAFLDSAYLWAKGLDIRNEKRYNGDGLELEQVPKIGWMQRITVSNLTAVDEACMSQVHYRFGEDIMGEPKFNGIRIDANKDHPIEDITLSNIRYQSIGGVKRSDIPADYPEVVDKLTNSRQETSENYYPDWSRTAFADIRNVDGLVLENVVCHAVRPDERTPLLTEGCRNVTGTVQIRD